ncbi:ABC transporter ATP-binding protein [Paenibacillus sp. SC116]|uniref:ABC transporter ATP-binding protein n=1 Tax=Paenibacillus sp. SC116 TaxID=2968986 RepID=UPI00215B566F|nr:ABC transporter ATP-binding protein [Paenibacillus sp. SC116]MCR8842191.1 ABC transporter ATP-binding protein [Paenibacillus sp. SC116]
MTFVSIKNLTFRYSKRQMPIIDNLSFAINKGEIVGIVGASGSGKSTLLRIIAGLEQPEKGIIEVDHKVMMDDRCWVETEQRGVGMVFQDYALFPHLNVADNIAFGLHKLKRSERKEQLREMLELVQMTEYAKRFPHELSGGQQQRVAMARALAPKPSILLMDEPFSNLDAHLKAGIRTELLQILRKAGITCLFVSHDQADIEAICEREFCIVANSKNNSCWC